MDLKNIIRKSIDLHVHVGPEIIPRKFGLEGLVKYEKNKITGIGIKNHFFPTISMEKSPQKNKLPLIIHSVTLNNYLGGFNPEAIRASADLSNNPIIVWFPTVHSRQFLKGQKYEIPQEWLDMIVIFCYDRSL